ncbi:VOC family protein [Acidobacteria bacterium AH-259-D05]|nr:VOC family protein [Acidobacteria bacterium AH-259-D05]
MPSEQLRGKFVWHELLTTDLDAAKEFYTQLIGWGTKQWEGSDPYTMWMNQDTPVGGVVTLSEEELKEGVPPHWLAFLGAPDIDSVKVQVEGLGGRILVEPTEVPDAGRFSIMADPQGALFAVFAPTWEVPSHGELGVGDFSWHELATIDHAAAFDFYSAIFSWRRTESMDMSEMGLYQMYGKEDTTYGGIYNKSAQQPGPPNWLLYVQVEDVDRSAEKVVQLGGSVVNGPMEVPGGDRIAQCVDPQGAAFALHAFS